MLLVNCDTVCKGKDFGGLGIRSTNRNNIALLSKLGWKVSSETSPFWIQAPKAKYLKSCSLKDYSLNKPASHIWKAINKIKDLIAVNTKWAVGRGSNISFWHDWWVSDRPLLVYRLRKLTDYDHGLKVSEVLSKDGYWDMDYLDEMIPPRIIQSIIAICTPKATITEDQPIWGQDKSGKFTTLLIRSLAGMSAYKKLSRNATLTRGWNWIWKLKIPQKLKSFLWTLSHGKMLTNEIR